MAAVAFAAMAVVLPGFANATNLPRTSGFETGNLSEWDIAPNVTPSTSKVVVDRTGPCNGSYSATASIPGDGSANQFARTIWGNSSGTSQALNLGAGTDFWYSTALFLPTGFTSSMQSYYVPMRWDNYGVSNVTRSGISMYNDGNFRLMAERSGSVPQYNLLGSTTFKLSENVWHSLEVHQKLATTDGAAVNELYVDGRLIGSSTMHNYFGEPVSAIRYGIVAINQGVQTKPLTVRFDNAYLGLSRNANAACTGAAAGPATSPSPASSPTPSPTSSPTSAPATSGGDTQAPSPATNVRVTARTATSATVAWGAATDNVGVTKYELWRGDASYGNWTLVGSAGGSALSLQDNSLTSGATYTYAVRALDAAGNKSASSNTVVSGPPSSSGDTTAPTAPASLRVTGTSSGVSLAWGASSDNVGVTRYEVWRGDANWASWALVGTVNGSTLAFKDATARAGTTYTYGIRAFDAAGNKSASSNSVKVTAG